MNTLKTAIIGTAAATAMAVSATPAMAKGGHHKNKVSAGEVIAGAVVLGGLAAILTSGKKDRHSNNYDRGYRGDHNVQYNRGDRYNHGQYGRISERKAIKKCVRTAERRAGRQYGWANVTDVRKVKQTRYGYKIKGRIVVKDQAYNNRGRYQQNRYGNGRYHQANQDQGKFTCYIEGRGKPQVNFKGLDRSRRY